MELRKTYGDLREILRDVASGKLEIEEAVRLLRIFSIQNIEQKIKFDLGRSFRRDVPEIVFCEGKNKEDLLELIKKVTPIVGKLILTRLSEEQIRELVAFSKVSEDFEININKIGRTCVVKLKGYEGSRTLNCKVGIITAGTADIRVAEEVRTILEENGCNVVSIFDVGIAGLHRTIEAVKKIKEENVDVAIVVAGMEGALPSVIASMLDIPIIGVPTSVGYGAGGDGISALLSMLQACPLGLTVVNIDNGVNAAISALLICRRINTRLATKDLLNS
ncbi:MAG: nickel pincer cofactor biosynthesis protein LarB [Zestosphaera sp.]